jgi:hypothetical protein
VTLDVLRADAACTRAAGFTVHRPGKRPEMFNDEETLSGDATLPNFETAAASRL